MRDTTAETDNRLIGDDDKHGPDQQEQVPVTQKDGSQNGSKTLRRSGSTLPQRIKGRDKMTLTHVPGLVICDQSSYQALVAFLS